MIDYFGWLKSSATEAVMATCPTEMDFITIERSLRNSNRRPKQIQTWQGIGKRKMKRQR